jgi:hypothetical protein
MDVSIAYLPSPKVKMSSLLQLARMIDKPRAYRENKMSDYIYSCPLDKIILNFLHINSDVFTIKAVDSRDDEISAWSQEILKDKNAAEIDFINDQILERRPDSEDRLKYFREIRNKIDSSREDINTWVDLMDLEEGRLPPK